MKAIARMNHEYQGTEPTYSDCRYSVLEHVNNICIQFKSNQQTIWIKGDRYEMLQVLEDMVKHLTPKSMADRNDDVLSMTPGDVLAYFRKSPVLEHMADEVQKVLGVTSAPESQLSDLETVRRRLDVAALFDNGAPVYGAQARIARALGIPNAGSYRKRVTKVLAQLVELNSTTTQSRVEVRRNVA